MTAAVLLQIALNNTYAILRLREPSLTVRTLKADLARSLATLVAADELKTVTGVPVAVRLSQTPAEISKLRLNHEVPHTLWKVKNDKRRQCVVHVARHLTPFYCGACGVHMCYGTCWERFHFLQDYLLQPVLDDGECSVQHRKVQRF